MQAKVVDLCRPLVVAAACRGDSGEVHQTAWRGMMDGGGDERREKHRWIGWTRLCIGPLTWAVPWTGYCSDAPHSSAGPTPPTGSPPPHTGTGPRVPPPPCGISPGMVVIQAYTIPLSAWDPSFPGDIVQRHRPMDKSYPDLAQGRGIRPSSPLVTGFFPAKTPPRIARGPLDSPGRL